MSQQSIQMHLIRKPASISIQHPEQLGNPTPAIINPNRYSHENPKKALLIEQLAGGHPSRHLGNELRNSTDQIVPIQRTPGSQNQSGQLNFQGNQGINFQAQSHQEMPTQLNTLVAQFKAKREVPQRNEAFVSPNFSQRVSHQKHISLSPVRSNGQAARDIAASNANNNGGGVSYRQRLMTEHSNPRDSSQDQINSIKDFAVSQGMVSQKMMRMDSTIYGNVRKEKAQQLKKSTAAPASGQPGANYPLKSNRNQDIKTNAVRNSTNSFKGFQQLYQQNQMKIEQLVQQNVSQLQKANAKLNQKGANASNKHKKTKSTGVNLGLHARNNAGLLLRQVPTKQTKKGDNPLRKSARSTSNNNQQATQQGVQQSQLAQDQGKAYHNKHPIETVDGQGKATGRFTQRAVANMATATRHTSSRSNKSIQKFQTHFPSSFNSNAKGMQYYNESHGQSGVSIGISNGSNSALDKLERQTANFGQALAERSSKLKAMGANQKAEQAQGTRAGLKSAKVKFSNGALASGNAANLPQQKQQASGNLKSRGKTENSQNKSARPGALPQQRQLSSENLLKYKEQVKQHKHQSVIKRPVQRQAQSHKISPKSRDGQITIPMMTDDHTSRTNQTNQPQAVHVKGRTPNSNALMQVPAQSTPAQSSRDAGCMSSQVRVPTTSSVVKAHDIDERNLVVAASSRPLPPAVLKSNQQKQQDALTLQSTNSKIAKNTAGQAVDNQDQQHKVEELMAGLQEIKVPSQQQSNRRQQVPYAKQGLDNNKQMINNFVKKGGDLDAEVKVLGELGHEAQEREQDLKKLAPNKDQKLINQIIQNYHNLDAQAQNYILKLFTQKTNKDPNQDEAHLQNYFDISLNQSGSATTFKQSELIQEQQFDSDKKATKDETAKESPFKKRTQAKQVDFMNKGLKSTNQIAVRKHRSRQNQSDPVSPSGKNTDDLLVRDLAETVNSEDKEDKLNTIVVDLGVINKSIKDMDKQTDSSKAEPKQPRPQAANSKTDGSMNRPGSANSDDAVRARPGGQREGRLQNLHQRLQSANDLNQSKGLTNESKDETQMEQEVLDRFYIPKNVVTKYAFATRVGYIPMNPSKVNQDTYILGPCIEGPENNSKHMFGVNDGHGQFGHHVSGFIKEGLLEIVKEMLEKDKSNQAKDQSAIAKEYEDLFQSAFLKCDQRLHDVSEKSKEQDSEIDFFDLRLSGSTVCTVFFDGTSVHCANVGDSRAIKVKLTYDENEKLQPVCEPLSEDHKPDLEAEKTRILGMGGRIDTFHDTQNNNEPIGPYRVWLKYEELPGLAMSRSLGDKIAHSVGVSSLPEVKSTFLGVDDKFIVLGTDGVWEFLSNEQVAEIVLPFYQVNQPEAAANAIVKEAYKKWREQEEVVDDITTVVIFVEPYMAYRQIDLESKLEKNIKKPARNHFVQKSNSQPSIGARLAK